MEGQNSRQEITRRQKRSRPDCESEEVVTLSCSCMDCRNSKLEQRKRTRLDNDVIVISSSSENDEAGRENCNVQSTPRLPTPAQSNPRLQVNVKIEKPTSEELLQCVPWLQAPDTRQDRSSPITQEASPFVNEALTRSWLAGLESEYSVGVNVIGAGAFGSVYAGFRKSDSFPVAIKRIAKTSVSTWGEIDGKRVPIEFQLLKKVSGHPGVIEMIDWAESGEDFLLIMERPSPVSDLFDYLKKTGPLPEHKARSVIIQLIKAVQHCHINGVIHRDIKDQNVLLNLESMTPKLIDFGCGAVKQILPFKSFHGTPIYSPPEWYACGRYIGTDFDVWGLGVLLYMLIENIQPFTTEKEIVEKDVVFHRGDISQSCRELIRWILTKDHASRPKIHQILRHRWFYEAARPWL